jgi:hypothetical protein
VHGRVHAPLTAANGTDLGGLRALQEPSPTDVVTNVEDGELDLIGGTLKLERGDRFRIARVGSGANATHAVRQRPNALQIEAFIKLDLRCSANAR